MTAAAIPALEPTRPTRGRRVAVGVLVVLAVLSTFVSTVAVWAHQVLLNTDAWVRTVGPLVDDEEVTDAVAAYIVDQVFILIDLEDVASDALPDKASFLAGPLTGAADQFLTEQVAKLLETDQFKEFWITANRTAHQQAVRLLRGEPGVVTLEQGQVTLSLLPIVAQALRSLDDRGWLPDGITVPDVTKDTPADEAVSAFEDAFGVDLPDDFAQFTVYDNDKLAQAQDAVRLFDRAVVASVVITILLGVAAIALARPRRRTVLQLSLGIIAGFIVAWAAIEIATNEILALISEDVNRSAATQVVNSILNNLRGITRIVSALAIVATIVAFLTGDGPWARRARAFLRSVFRREPLVGDEQPAGAMTAIGWIDTHRDGLRVAGLVVALLSVLVVDLTMARALVIVLILGGYELALAVVPGPAPEPAPGGDQDADGAPLTADRGA